MRYRLTTEDYLLLYPLLSPAKIADTFQGMCKSSRAIQQIYKNKNLPDTDLAMDELFKRSFTIADLDIDEQQWGIAFMSVISKALCERIETIRERAEKYEELF